MMRFVKALSLLSITIAAGATAPASAEEGMIGSGVTYGGGTQKRVVCYFTNQGGANVRISSVAVFSSSGVALGSVLDTCGGTGSIVLARGESCERAADIASNAVYGCRAKVSDVTNMRGTVEIRDQNQNVLNSLPMK